VRIGLDVLLGSLGLRNFSRSVFKKIFVLVLAFVIIVSAAYSTSATITANTGTSNLLMIGVDDLSWHSTAFIDSLASDGLKWAADNVLTSQPSYQDAQNANLVAISNAGINIIGELPGGMLQGTGFNTTSCSPQCIQTLTESQYKQYLTNMLSLYPYIHYWQWLNEPINPAYGNWTAQDAFQYLVWTYQVIHSLRPNDVLMGPTPTIIDSQGYCNPTWITWTEEFFAQKDPSTGLTADDILNYFALHFYPKGLLNSTLANGETMGASLSSCLNQFYSIGGDMPIIVTETGMPSENLNNSSDSAYSPQKQAEYFVQLFPFLQTKTFIQGVFAYEISDAVNPSFDTDTFGLFTTSLQPKPAWSVYQNYLSDTVTTITSPTTNSTTSVNSSSTGSSTSVSSSVSSNITISQTSSNSTTIATRSNSLSRIGPSSVTTSSSSFSSGRSSAGPSTTQSNVHTSILLALSPTKDPPVAFGIGSYEVFLIGSLGYIIMNVPEAWIKPRDNWRW
jgi:hypothetical protein